MGKNTLTVTIDETGESKSSIIDILDPEFIEGFWTKDKGGKKKLKEAVLGETVYFHVTTKGLADNQEIILKLYEQDKNIFMIDWIDPDDEKFPEEEVVKKATIKNNKASIKLLLQENWEVMIKDDSDNAFSLDSKLELYWEASYGRRKKELPTNDDNFLLVGYNNKTLYFKTPTETHNLPEFISYKGDPMFLMEFGKGFAKNKVISEGLNTLGDKAKTQISKIAFAKMEKGYMVDNTGKVHKGQRRVYEYKKMYSNSGELFENVKQGKDFGYKHAGKPLHTTKGLSQYDYFSKNGKRVKLLGMAKHLGSVFDIFNLVKTATQDLDTSQPLPLDFGPLSPIFDLAGVLVQEQKAEMDQWLEEEVQLEIDLAKLEGLEATRKVINTWNHNEEYNWQLMSISNETANKLLQGEFDTFEKLNDYNEANFAYDDRLTILYRETENTNKDQNVFIIETFFINE